MPGAPPALLFLVEADGHAADIEALYAELAARDDVLATFILAPMGDARARPTPSPLAPPIDVTIALDPARARRRYFPAIDPERSTSRLLASGGVEPRHATVAAAARELFARARALDPELGWSDEASVPPEHRTLWERAERAMRALVQPFHVAEPFTGLLGDDGDLQATLDALKPILAGRLDGTPLPDAWPRESHG